MRDFSWTDEFDGVYCFGTSFGYCLRTNPTSSPRLVPIKRSQNQYHPAEARLDIEYTFFQSDLTETRPSSSYVLTANEISRKFSSAGPTPIHHYASFQKQPYQPGSPRLLFIVQKRVLFLRY